MSAHTEGDHALTTPAPRSKALLATAALAVLLTAADTYVVVLALEEMMAGVGLGIDQLQKAAPIVSGFLLGYIAVLPLVGRLSDLVSRQRVLLWCLVLFGLGSVVTALAVDLPVVIGGRVTQGIGGGGLVPATLALVADLLPRGRRGVALGMVSAVQEVGAVVGPLLGAAVLAIWSWRAIFWLNAGAALVLAVVLAVLGRGASQGQPLRLGSTARRLSRVGWFVGALGAAVVVLALWAPDQLTSDVTYGPPFVPYEGHTSRLVTPIGFWGLGLIAGFVVLTAPVWWRRLAAVDVLGAALLTGALACVVWTFAVADSSKEVMSASGVWLLPLALVLLVAFVLRHRSASNPLIERGVLTGRVPAALVISFLVGTALVAVVVEIPVLARLTMTNSQTSAAFVLLRFLVAVPVGALLGGVLLRRLGPALVAAPGLAMASAALFVMAGWQRGALSDVVVSTIVLLVAGLGIGLAIAPVNDASLADAPESAHGVTSSLVVVGRMMGMVVGLALLTAVGLHRFSAEMQKVARPNGETVRDAGVVQVHTVFMGAGVAALVAAVVALFFLGRSLIAARDVADPLEG